MSPTPPKSPEATLATGNPFLTVAEVASFLRVTPSAVYALCHSGQIVYHEIGIGKKRKQLRILKSDYDAYLQGNRRAKVEMPEPTKQRASKAFTWAGPSILQQMGYRPGRGSN